MTYDEEIIDALSDGEPHKASTLAKSLYLGENTVRRCLRSLRHRGYLKSIKIKGNTNYWVRTDKVFVPYDNKSNEDKLKLEYGHLAVTTGINDDLDFLTLEDLFDFIGLDVVYDETEFKPYKINIESLKQHQLDYYNQHIKVEGTEDYHIKDVIKMTDVSRSAMAQHIAKGTIKIHKNYKGDTMVRKKDLLNYLERKEITL